MDIIKQLLQDIPMPRFVKAKQIFEKKPLKNIEHEIKIQLLNKNLLANIAPGQSIAIAAGSRGIANIALIIKELVKNIKEAGGQPFIIPAMGSHGGASAEGQCKILESLGITQEYIGAPIRATMEVVQIGTSDNGLPVYIDKFAHEADGIVVVNRIKPHVAFRGQFESGLMKMITIGIGKQKGADACHNLGFGQMAESIPAIGKKIIKEKNIVFAIGILEDAYDQTSEIIAMRKEEIEQLEPDLLDIAKNNLQKIHFKKFDALIIDEIGKDITGTGLDTNVVGRYHTPYASGGPQINKMLVLDLTDKSNGNGNGIGIVDFTTRRFYNKMRLDQTYPNSLTSTVALSVKIPMILESDKLAIQAAIKTCNIEERSKAKVVRIKNTLKLEEIYISESLLEEAKENKNIEIIGDIEELKFDQYGNLF